MTQDILKVIVCRVGQAPVIEDIPDTLEAMQGLVDGYLEHVTLPQGLSLWCNEEGLLKGMPFNRYMYGIPIAGDFFLTRANGPETASVRQEDLVWVELMTN